MQSMGRIFMTSDLHFGHDRDFVVQERGFSSVEEHDKAIVENWNSIVTEWDDVFILGDVMFLDTEMGLCHLSELNGSIHIIRGNHDSDRKIADYSGCNNIVEIADAKFLRLNGLHLTFYLSHFPAVVTTGELKRMRSAVINLYGHTHQKDNFFRIDGEPYPYMYHVGMDSHNMRPVLLDDIIEEIRTESSRYNVRHSRKDE